MNPTFKFTLAILIALEISFTNSWVVNVILASIGLLIVLFQKPSFKRLLALFFWPLIPATALAIAILMQSRTPDNTHFALVLFTRIYAYVFVGSAATLSTSVYDLIMSLEQNAHVPTKFAYGFLGGFNLMPKIVSEVTTIRVSARMRGQRLSFWSPQLYFKAIIASLRWSENLAEAMTSHGFIEDQSRTHYTLITIRLRDWVGLLGSLLILQGLLFGLQLP